MAFKLRDLTFSSMRMGKEQSQLYRFCAGVCIAELLHARIKPLYSLPHFGFKCVRCSKKHRTILIKLLIYSLPDFRMSVSKHQCTVGKQIIDILIAVNIVKIGIFSLFHNDWMGSK